MPRVAPVTIAFLPLRPRSIFLSSFCLVLYLFFGG